MTTETTGKTAKELAILFSEMLKQEITPDMIEEDIKEGCPTNPDGTLSIFVYAAWLNQRILNA